MFCSRCGTVIPEGSNYCPSCGFAASPVQEGGAPACTAQPPVRKIGFGQAVRNYFTQYATFSGRATRSEYWYVFLFNILVSTAISLISSLISAQMASVISVLYSLVTLIPGLAITWRRLHDIGRSGGWYFIGLVPLVGWIIVLVFVCKDSDGDNRFGPRKV